MPWSVVAPVLAFIALALTWGQKIEPLMGLFMAVLLAGAVLAAVHHAEVVAHRVGEPFGSLVLAIAVTVIEVALIVTLMAGGGHETATLARDTVFAAVMITTNGIAGLALLLGSRRYGVTLFNDQGSGSALAMVTTLATLSLVLPTFTTSKPGPQFSPASSPSPRPPRWACIYFSCSRKRSGIGISSCRWPKRAPSMITAMRNLRVPAWRCAASGFCWSRW
ncbi:putative membrane protein [Mycobacterium kansasii 732]|nr:putative membrane protein [Mycobacterium kansasii 732]